MCVCNVCATCVCDVSVCVPYHCNALSIITLKSQNAPKRIRFWVNMTSAACYTDIF